MKQNYLHDAQPYYRVICLRNCKQFLISTFLLSFFIVFTSFNTIDIKNNTINTPKTKYNIACKLKVNIGKDQIICKNQTIKLTAETTGASICKSIQRRFRITDATMVKGCPNKIGGVKAVLLQRDSNDPKGQYTLWQAGKDLMLTEYKDNTAEITGSVYRYHNGKKQVGSIAVTLSSKISTSSKKPPTWDNPCYLNRLSGTKILYQNFNGTIKTNNKTYTVSPRKGYHFITSKGASLDKNKYGLGGWTGGTFGGATEWFGHLTSTSFPTTVKKLTYLWNTGATTKTITITKPGTYTVTVTDCNGCKATHTIKVTEATVNAGIDQSICKGDTTTLMATAAAGTTYLWSTGETTASIDVAPMETTTYTVTATNGSCAITDTVKVAVNTNVVEVDAGIDQAICKGDTATLSATETTDATYLWSTGETTTSIEVAPMETTTYTITATYTNGNCTTTHTDTVTVAVNTSAIEVDAGNDQTICKGDNATLSATETTGATYLWSTGETTTSIEVSPMKTTTYTVTATQTNGKCTAIHTDTVTVVVNTSAIEVDAGSDVAICKSGTTILIASATAEATYLWSTGETTASIEVSPMETTTYTVTATQTNGKCTATHTDTVTVAVRTGMNNTGSDSTVEIDPTCEECNCESTVPPIWYPTCVKPSGKVHIEFTTAIPSNDITLSIYSNTGLLVKTKVLQAPKNNTILEIDLTDFPKLESGIYFFRINNYDGFYETKKIIIHSTNN